MRIRFLRSFIFTGCLALLSSLLYAQNVSSTAVVPDSLLREQLTRAVQIWQKGKALPTYQTLDSITSQPVSIENAASKVKAAIWTATYLQQQKKYKPASKFLDSALVWASTFGKGEELKRSYEAYSQWYLANGNPKAAMAAQQQAWLIKDSLNQVRNNFLQDSLSKSISDLQNKIESINSKETEIAQQQPETKSVSLGFIVMGIVIVILLILVLRLSGKLKGKTENDVYQEKIVKVQATEILERSKKVDSKIPDKKEIIESTPKDIILKEETVSTTSEKVVKTKDTSPDILSLTAKLSTVELVLIRPDVFAWKANGEAKVIQKFLQKYVDEFPGMMKNLDDAIAINDGNAILKSTIELKPFLEQFGMSGTVSWITEIEAEAPDVKVNKILSRVFQVRNHVRRALDEAKAILTKVSL